MSEPFDNLRQNEYLQMGHEVIAWIERAKEQTETLLDSLPCVFAIIDEHRRILRGNSDLAKLLGRDESTLEQASLSDAFSASSWHRFEAFLSACTQSGKPQSFELSHPGLADDERVFAWNVRRFSQVGVARPWFLLFGQEITNVAWTERKLAALFASIPVGILRVDVDGRIAEPVSQAASFLLGEGVLEGRSFFEIVFQPIWNSLTQNQRESVGLLLGALGQTESQYAAVESHFLREFYFSKNDEAAGRWLTLSYHPLLREGVVSGYLVVLQGKGEDASAGARERGLRSAVTPTDEAQLFAAVSGLEPGVRGAVCLDISVFLDGFGAAVEGRDNFSLLRKIHGLRGAFRVARFGWMGQMAAELEESLLFTGKHPSEGWDRDLRPRLRVFSDACRRILHIVEFFVFREQGTQGGCGAVPASVLPSSLESFLLQAVHGAARANNCLVSVVFDWGDNVQIPASNAAALNESLVAIVEQLVPLVAPDSKGLPIPQIQVMWSREASGSIVVAVDAEVCNEKQSEITTDLLPLSKNGSQHLTFVVDRMAIAGGKVYVEDIECRRVRWVLTIPA